jgi:hypothetical protein
MMGGWNASNPPGRDGPRVMLPSTSPREIVYV